MTYARQHRRAVKRLKEKQKKGEPLHKWEKKRLEHEKALTSKKEE